MKPNKVIAWRRRAAAAEELAREAQRIKRSVELQKIVAEALLKELRGLRFEVRTIRRAAAPLDALGDSISKGEPRSTEAGVSQ